jgi:hypothetical protein
MKLLFMVLPLMLLLALFFLDGVVLSRRRQPRAAEYDLEAVLERHQRALQRSIERARAEMLELEQEQAIISKLRNRAS